MPTNINSFKIFVETEQNKVQSGNSITVDQFNILANQAQYICFEEDYDIYVKSQKKVMSQFLNAFLKRKVGMAINSEGIAIPPSDYEHTSSMRIYYSSDFTEGALIPCREIDNIAIGEIAISSLNKPTKRFPKYSEYADYFQFFPLGLGLAYLDYFKTPTAPIWNYTIVDDTEVYNPTGSVDFAFDSYGLNRVAGQYLVLVGNNLQSENIIKAGQDLIAKTTSL